MDYKIDPEFQALLPERSKKEKEELRKAIEGDGGCTDPIIVWGPDRLVADGHGRLEVLESQSEGSTLRPPRFEELDLPDRAAVIFWMLRRQLGRRNLKPMTISILRGRLYNETKKSRGGSKKGRKTSQKSSGNSCHLKNGEKTDEEVGTDTGVSARTVRSDADLATALDAIGAINAKAKADIESGDWKVSKKDVVGIGSLPSAEIGPALGRLRTGKPWQKDEPPSREPGCDDLPEPIKDDEGEDVPDGARPAFHAAGTIKAWGRKIDALVREAKEFIAGPAGRMMHLSHVEQHLKAAKGDVVGNLPSHVCPYCHGRRGKKPCECCQDDGWTSKHVWHQAPGNNEKVKR